jgi:hypothetical protein
MNNHVLYGFALEKSHLTKRKKTDGECSSKIGSKNDNRYLTVKSFTF